MKNLSHTLGIFLLRKEGECYIWTTETGGLKFTKKIAEEDFIEYKEKMLIDGCIIHKEYFEKAKTIFKLMDRDYEIWVTEKKAFPVALISKDENDGSFDSVLIAPIVDNDLENEIWNKIKELEGGVVKKNKMTCI